MPYKSRSQMRAFFAMENRGDLPEGTAERWAHHTKNIKKLPEHVRKADSEKKAFVARFLLKCAAAGLTTPGEIAAAAEAMAKSADVFGDLAGRVAGLGTLAPIVGSVGLPLLGGFGLGSLAAKAKNQADTDDADALRLRAEANAYRRRAAEAKTHAQVKQMVSGSPGKYVVLS